MPGRQKEAQELDNANVVLMAFFFASVYLRLYTWNKAKAVRWLGISMLFTGAAMVLRVTEIQSDEMAKSMLMLMATVYSVFGMVFCTLSKVLPHVADREPTETSNSFFMVFVFSFIGLTLIFEGIAVSIRDLFSGVMLLTIGIELFCFARIF